MAEVLADAPWPLVVSLPVFSGFLSLCLSVLEDRLLRVSVLPRRCGSGGRRAVLV